MDDGNITPQNAGRQEPDQRRNEAKRLKSRPETPEGPRTCLKLTIPREGKRPLIAIFGGLSLKRRKNPVIKDQVLTPYVNTRSEIIERLLNDTCEVCGAKEKVQMHHIRKLRDLNKQGKREMPLWMKIMITRKRKSIPLCKTCHDDIHHNRPRLQRHRKLESRMTRKCHVRLCVQRRLACSVGGKPTRGRARAL